MDIKMAVRQADITSGSRWREVDTNRIIIILHPMVYGAGPSYRYEDGGDPKCVNWHYCDIADFLIWKRFKLLSR